MSGKGPSNRGWLIPSSSEFVPGGRTVDFETQGSQEEVVGNPATAVTGNPPDQPYTQPEDSDGSEFSSVIPETPLSPPALPGNNLSRGLEQNAQPSKRKRGGESDDERGPILPPSHGMDTAEVLKGVGAKLQKIVDKQESTARLLAIEAARIEDIIGDSHWPTEDINKMGLRPGLRYRRHKDLVVFSTNALDELEKSAEREEELREREEELRAAQQRIRELEARIQAGPQPVSPAAGGAGYSPVSPAGGAGCQPVSSDGQNWMMPPMPYCKCTDRPQRPYVPRRIRKEGPKQGMVVGACANWEFNGYPGCGWYGDPFPWPKDLSPK